MKSFIKKLLAAALSCIMLIGVGTTAFAADSADTQLSIPLYIGNARIQMPAEEETLYYNYTENLINGDSIVAPATSQRYDFSLELDGRALRLTLNSINITLSYRDCGIYANVPLDIIITDGATVSLIGVGSKPLKDSKLSIEKSDTMPAGIYAYGNLSIRSLASIGSVNKPTLKISDYTAGLAASNGTVAVSNVNVSVSDCGFGVLGQDGVAYLDAQTEYVPTSLSITNSIFNIESKLVGLYAYRISAQNSDITISSIQHGIYCYSLNIASSKLDISAGDDGINAENIYYYDTDANITGGLNSAVDSAVDAYYIYYDSGLLSLFSANGQPAVYVGYFSFYSNDCTIRIGSAANKTRKITLDDLYQAFYNDTFTESYLKIDAGDDLINDLIFDPIYSGSVDGDLTAFVKGSAVSFKDAAGTWFKGYASDASALGIMNGYPDGTFKGNGSVTLAEVIKMAAVARSIYTRDGYVFNQNSGTYWFSTYVDYAISNSIIGGSDYLDYTRAATRTEMASIFARILASEDLAPVNSLSAGSIPDLAATGAHASDILTLYRAGVLTGSDSAHTFNGGDNVTRGEAAAIIARVCLSENRIK